MTKAFICGCLGPSLTDAERVFIASQRPGGLILFKRNVVDRANLAALTQDFRRLVGRADAPVLIDQEGGRVQRMGPPHWEGYVQAARFETLGDDEGPAAARLSARLMAFDLAEVGITVDCAPVLDVADEATHAVIGTRAYSRDPRRVAIFARAVCEGLLAGGVAPVVKHMPGHGRGRVDSHLELPTVDASLEELEACDFAPFRALKDMPIAMTAHIRYMALDPERPATVSPAVVGGIMRERIGFDGLILSDDLSMKALGGTMEERVEAVFAAGVDVALHCNGDPGEADVVAAAAPDLRGKALARAEAALRRADHARDGGINVAEARADLARHWRKASFSV